ncbi:MAG: CHASE domain-containing protein [Alphaproteobacteria bacterium]|nr:CHASE domain-containing protein [Alphaproteobacteria bacterium]
MGIFGRRETFTEILRHPMTAWTVLVLSLLLTGLAWWISNNFVHQRAEDRFRFEVADITTSLQKRMRAYEAVLRGGAGLFEASDRVTRQGWKKFFSTLRIDQYFPGIQGIGYGQVVSPADLSGHIAAVRGEGFPDYTVYPEGKRETYTPVVYLEPFTGRNLRAFGYDMFSEPVRRAAMERARDIGNVSMSGTVTLVQETGTDVQQGFLMYLPLYRQGAPTGTIEQRRVALQGFVYSPFRIKDLMRGILGSGMADVSFHLYDGDGMSPQSLLYDDDVAGQFIHRPDHRPDFDSTSTLAIGDHVWTLYVHTMPEFISVVDAIQPSVVAVGGIVVDLLLFLIVNSVARQRKRAVAMADDMTEELRRSKNVLLEKADALERVNGSLDQFTHVLAHHLQEPVRLQYAFAQLLEMLVPAPLSPEAKKALDRVLGGAHRLHDLLHDAELYLSAYRLPQTVGLCDADAALEVALHNFERTFTDTGATIERQPLPPVWISQSYLTDVLSAILDNAIRFHHHDRPLHVKIWATSGEGQVVLSVCDNGIGIDPQYHARVFDVFEQLNQNQGASGTGIGLSLAKRIVESAGGRIWIENADTGGVCVRIALRSGGE